MPSATANLGPHLLGRVFVPDHRDLRLENLLAIEAAFREEMTLADLANDPAFTIDSLQPLWRFILELRKRPLPPPDVKPVNGVWQNPEPTLNQGQTPHCVGFGWSQFGNTLPINDRFGNQDGHAIYYAAKIKDGEPRAETGSSVRSGALVMRDRGRIAAFAFARNTSEIDTWLGKRGPVVVGTSWTRDMFNPNRQTGLIRPTGPVQGGHCYLLDGIENLSGTSCYGIRNSWGEEWGVGGRGRIRKTDLAALLSSQGEACLCLELPANKSAA